MNKFAHHKQVTSVQQRKRVQVQPVTLTLQAKSLNIFNFIIRTNKLILSSGLNFSKCCLFHGCRLKSWTKAVKNFLNLIWTLSWELEMPVCRAQINRRVNKIKTGFVKGLPTVCLMQSLMYLIFLSCCCFCFKLFVWLLFFIEFCCAHCYRLKWTILT